MDLQERYVADVHRAQQTDPVKSLLQSKKTIFVNVPPGSITRVQALDVLINKPFKNAIKEQFERHFALPQVFSSFTETNGLNCERHHVFCLLSSSKMAFSCKSIVILCYSIPLS